MAYRFVRPRTRSGFRNHRGSVPANGIENTLLLGLPRKERDAIASKLEWIDLPTHTVLNELRHRIRFAYFLNSGLASILTVMVGGKSVEVGLTGKDGFVGVPLLAGLSRGPSRIVMQVGGAGFRMKVRDMQDALRNCVNFRKAVLHYSQELTMQATQVAACNRLHRVDRRLARWLLMSQDRLGGNIVPLTQQYLAHMLGTRRASVTVAASSLQRADLISYNRGVVTVKSRKKLEGAVCECYRIMRRQSRQWQNEAKKLPPARP